MQSKGYSTETASVVIMVGSGAAVSDLHLHNIAETRSFTVLFNDLILGNTYSRVVLCLLDTGILDKINIGRI